VHHATGLGLELTFRQSNHEGKSPTPTSATNITGIRRFVGRDQRYLRLGPHGHTEAMHARPAGEKIPIGADANYA
jgi:hypothetical protein